MRYPATTDETGTPTLVVEDKHGSGKHGFTDGSPVLFVSSLGVNGDATEIRARVMDDLVTNVKEACIEGNGQNGPLANAVDDDPYELAAAVNTAANVLTGTASFACGGGLLFSTSGASLNVELSDGLYVFEGRKYHATEERLSDAIVLVDDEEAGNGDAFTLPASSDCYISIGPDTDSTVSVTVVTVPNDDAAPDVPVGEFVFAIIVTDGTGVTSVRYMPRIVLESDDEGNGLEIGDVPIVTTPFSTYMPNGTSGVILPRSAGSNIGALSTADVPTQDDGGRFVGTIHARGLWLRSGTNASIDAFDGRVFPVNRRTTTVGNATAHVSLANLANLANESAIRVEITVIAYSSLNQIFSRKISRCASKTSGGVMTLDGSDVAMGTDHDPGATGATVATTLSGNVVRASVTGAVGHNFTWFVSAEVFLMGGI